MVAFQHIGVLVSDAEPRTSGAAGARVIEGNDEFLRIVFRHGHLRIDRAIRLAHGQGDIDLPGRIFVGQLDVLGQAAGIRHRALLQGRQAGTHPIRGKVRVARDGNLAQAVFTHLQPDMALRQFLFRHVDDDRAVPQAAVGIFQCFKCLLHVTIILVRADERRQQDTGLARWQQGIAFDGKVLDFEAIDGRRYRSGSGCGNGRCRDVLRCFVLWCLRQRQHGPAQTGQCEIPPGAFIHRTASFKPRKKSFYISTMSYCSWP
jgi:ribosomal protein S26